MTTLLWSILFLLAAAITVVAAELFIGHLTKSSSKKEIPSFLSFAIPVFLVALPELLIALIATWKDFSSMVPTYVTGANLINLLLIPGIMALTAGSFISQKEENLKQIPFLLGSVALFLVFSMNGQIELWEGLVLFLTFAAFGASRYKDFKLGIWERIERLFHSLTEGESHSPSNSASSLILWFLILLVGAFFTVKGVSTISEAQNWNPGYLASSVVALAVSVPEMVFAIRAAKKGNGDAAVNVLMASSVLNLTLVVATSAFVKPLNVLDDVVSISNTFLLLATLLFCFSLLLRKWSGSQGAVLVLIYFVFLVQFLNPLFS